MGSKEERPAEQDAPLREEDVTAGDKLDDRVQEAEGLPEADPEADDGRS